jgi:hypothetical protein
MTAGVGAVITYGIMTAAKPQAVYGQQLSPPTFVCCWQDQVDHPLDVQTDSPTGHLLLLGRMFLWLLLLLMPLELMFVFWLLLLLLALQLRGVWHCWQAALIQG